MSSAHSTGKLTLKNILELEDPALSCNFRLVFTSLPVGIFASIASSINAVTSYLWGTGRSFLGVDLTLTPGHNDLVSARCRSASIAATSIEPIIVEHKGHKGVYPGRRVQENSATFEFLEDQEMSVSTIMRAWMNEARRMDDNTGKPGKNKTADEYLGSATLITYKQDGKYSAGYVFRSLWPTQIGEIQFAGSNAEVVAVSVTFAYDVCHFDSNAGTTLWLKYRDLLPG